MAASKVPPDTSTSAKFGRGLVGLSMTPERCIMEIHSRCPNSSRGIRRCASGDAREGTSTGSPPPIVRHGRTAIRRRSRRAIWCGRVTCFRCAPASAGCWCGRSHEAAVDARIAGLEPAGVIGDHDRDGSMARVPPLHVRAQARLWSSPAADLISTA